MDLVVTGPSTWSKSSATACATSAWRIGSAMATSRRESSKVGKGSTTLTPHDSRVGMCSFRDVASRGLASTNRKALPSSRSQSSRRTSGADVGYLVVGQVQRDQPGQGRERADVRHLVAAQGEETHTRQARPAETGRTPGLLRRSRNTRSGRSPSGPMSVRSLSPRFQLPECGQARERAHVGDLVVGQVQASEPGERPERPDVTDAIVLQLEPLEAGQIPYRGEIGDAVVVQA